jgi:hypothetical protein
LSFLVLRKVSTIHDSIYYCFCEWDLGKYWDPYKITFMILKLKFLFAYNEIFG